MKRRRKQNEPEETSFWQSYSDMMAALLLVFILIIATSKFSYDKASADAVALQKTLDVKEQELLKQEETLKENKKLLKENEDKVAEQEGKLKEQQKQLDDIVGVRTEIVEKLKDEFEGSDVDISVDADTGAISFDSSVLFDYKQSDIKASGEEFLKKFFPSYFKIILSDEVKEYIAEVIIEGHTDNVGGYIYNLDLSQQRAFSVAEYCLSDNSGMFSSKELGTIRKLVTANGRSSNDLIYKDKEKKTIDAEASRRVEIKFRLTEEEMIKQMSEILEK